MLKNFVEDFGLMAVPQRPILLEKVVELQRHFMKARDKEKAEKFCLNNSRAIFNELATE